MNTQENAKETGFGTGDSMGTEYSLGIENSAGPEISMIPETPMESEEQKTAKQDEALQAIQNVGSYGIASKGSGIPWKKILIILVAIIAVAAIAFLVWQLVRSKYTDAIDEQIQILNDRDANLENCLDASVGEMKKQFVMDFGDFIVEQDGNCDEWNAGIESVFKSQYESLEKSFGEDFEVTYEIKEETHLTEDELKSYYEDIGDYLTNKIYLSDDYQGLDEDQTVEMNALLQQWYEAYREVEVTDGYSAIVTIKYKSSSTEREVNTRMVVVQIDGEWIVRVGSLLPLDSTKIFENMPY